MTKQMNYCDLTNYPKIYRKTYWGGFPVKDNPSPQSIIDARNKFIQEYNIKECMYPRTGYIIDYLDSLDVNLDHVEVYRSRAPNVYVIVNSPYAGRLKNGDREKILNSGFERWEQLYPLDAETYIKTFVKLKRKYNRKISSISLY